ncbi:MAG: cysteine--tRNA ligase [Aestuariivirga sp.]|uniref:cysteine--tRNA ligase n=1 Tax=Aestuariivirga sp. TaxID=2650926 RepID=UPI0038CF7A45
MPIRLYNTLTRTKEEFVPLDPANVRMYVCGPTVWDYAHIGNARPVIVFDVLFRLLRQIYGADHVKYVRNITDVDDKINARARSEGIAIGELTERTTRQFHEDIAALGVLPPTVEPRATQHIAGMIAIIERLISSGHAYVADGHVLFDVPSMPDYGQLSRRSLDEMLAGARVDVAPYKRGEMDFVLWKPSDAETPGWDSPWGRGRPGWHIECSAMSWQHLGEEFDIHGGGIDLVFPHHENEIAQTRCAFGHPIMAKYWMHNGFLQVEGQKMSKSLGNFLTIRQLLDDWPGDVLRFNMLRTHYRQPIDWTLQSLQESRRVLLNFQKHYTPGLDRTYGPEAPVELIDALSDDLNTPSAIAVLHEMLAAIVKLERANDPEQHRVRNRFSNALRLLGFANLDQLQHRGMGNLDKAEESKVDFLIAARLAARKAKNWAESDRIRDELAAMGIAIKDNKDGTTSWEVKR